MERFRIIEINNSKYENYIVKDDHGQKWNIGFKFYDIDTLPKVDDYICLSEKYFDKKANEGITFFSFGSLSGICGRDVSKENLDECDEIIIIEQGNKRTYLKRFYG